VRAPAGAASPDGTSYSVTGALAAVAATSATNAWAVGTVGTGSSALIVHWNGNKWTSVPTATVRIVNTTVDGSTSCAFVNVYLYDNHGAADNPVGSATLWNNTAATLSVPGTLPGDPAGLYYLAITGAFNPCHSAGAASYSIEPEPGTEWGSGGRALPYGPG